MNLDLKWIGFGALIMFGLSILAGIILALMLGAQLQGASDVEDVVLSGGQIALVASLNFLAFVVGGFIVGVKSAGRTILEPGIAAALAVVVVLAMSGNLSVTGVLASGLVPFLAGVLGGWLGERRQAAQASG
jgi:hypothetical protein